MFYRKRLLIGLILSLSFLFTSPAFAESYTSIQQIVETTPERWTETYETKWRTIQVDAEIIVPNVETFPIITIQKMPKLSSSLLTEYSSIQNNRDASFCFEKLKDDYLHVNEGYKSHVAYEQNEIPSEMPENVDITFDEAKALALSEANRLWGLNEDDLLLTRTRISSCVYKYKETNGVKTWGSAVTKQGRFHFSFAQLFHGIEMEDGRSCYLDLSVSRESTMCSPSYFISFSSNLDNAKVRAILYTEKEVIYDDVPLLPFSAAKEAIEQEIYAGRLRTIDEVKLCYVSYLDPNDAKTIWLLPAWYVVGDYSRDPEEEYKYTYDKYTGEEVDNGLEQLEVIFQAQAGTLIDYTATSNSRRNVISICLLYTSPSPRDS